MQYQYSAGLGDDLSGTLNPDKPEGGGGAKRLGKAIPKPRILKKCRTGALPVFVIQETVWLSLSLDRGTYAAARRYTRVHGFCTTLPRSRVSFRRALGRFPLYALGILWPSRDP